jgi:AraC-like DNA-binding protein
MGKSRYFKGAIKNIGIIQGIIPAGRKTGIRVFSHDFLAVMTVGEASFKCGKEGVRAIKSKAAVYIPAGVQHSYDPNPEVYWNNYWMIFDGNAAKNSFGEILPSGPGVFQLAETDKIANDFMELSNVVLSEKTELAAYGFFLFHSILINLHMQIDKISSVSRKTRFSVALQEIRDMALEPDVDLEKLSLRHGLGYDNFRKLFKQQVGISPKQYFLNAKINQCKSLLVNSSLSIKQIAGMAGFDNQYYFSRLFKSKTGVSPRSFRSDRDYQA